MSTITRWTAVVLVAISPYGVSAQTHDPSPAREAVRSGTALRGAIRDSMRLLVIEHATRLIVQEKTRVELGGPFWQDYARSVRVPRQWSDGDGWLVNYVGHPGHGAAAGFIWLRHDPDSPPIDDGFTARYWRSRVRATVWSAVYSLQFEIGPFSEASIGNVGMNPATGGWVDHIVTPVGALAVMVAEDAIDRHIIRRLERRVGHPVARVLLRTALNPARSLANVAGGQTPWFRDPRDLDLRRYRE